MNIIEYVGSIGGITGVLAFIMFMIYRQDRKYTEARLGEVIKEYNEASHAITQALTELITWLKMKNSHN